MPCANVGARRRVAACECDDTSWHVPASAGQGSQNANGTSSAATTTVPGLTRAAQPPASSPICARAVLPIHSHSAPTPGALPPARRTADSMTAKHCCLHMWSRKCRNNISTVVHGTSWHIQIITLRQREQYGVNYVFMTGHLACFSFFFPP